uniref:Uncharacterized protein n=1 Tax=Helicotheca tamesis TaxID=374047 RepID=A0A7S2DX52_9STRA|mmetsp:Transcript_10448/g.14631  ORF Transcript_10448/g.14631 Transcript_10448/m.14631 type:complete len:267 (+) Transcript_10448:148-948(+)|eukprot:CAMPEP_0185739636 /NCGR_PEP_ID=MMETSP1171-20130828/35868_1 /TAXON_ID=374046 /ORGANISM="Helicotheca tamensis, Strain CCMP826" /LENGTH=266 /DNA_ID=CAMNT_0028411255 /DNA_START=97 /DNA_END=897 /DNA_ORIENTATION=+
MSLKEEFVETEEEVLKYLNEEADDQLRDVFIDVEGTSDSGTWEEALWNSLALIGIMSALLAISREDSFLVTFVGVVCLIATPAAAIKEVKLTNMEALRALARKMREQVKLFAKQNKRLKSENDRLEKNVNRLKSTESALEEISKQQGQSVEMLIKQVEEFKKIQKDIKQSLEAQIIQNLISVIMAADQDGDFVMEDGEIDELILRLNSVEGVQIDEVLFKKVLKKSNHSLSAVLEIVRNLLDDKVPEEENIFKIVTNKLLPRELQT